MPLSATARDKESIGNRNRRYGEIMDRVILYVHGKGGNAAEAERYRKNCPDYDIVGVNYSGDFPEDIQIQISVVYDELREKYDRISVIAESIGAYFAMLSLQMRKIEKALFISPILDMENLILDMLRWANAAESDLCREGEILTAFGETLSWKYLCYVREHPIVWNIPTAILYAGHDHLTSRKAVDDFVKHHDATLTVMEDGEHWFHTEEQTAFLDDWMRKTV